MVQQQAKKLRLPTGGVVKDTSFQEQRPFTTPDASNVRPYGTFDDRRRIGSRPGFTKAYSQQISGGANPIRLLTSIRVVTEATDVNRNILVASANGQLWSNVAAAATMANLSMTLQLATGIQLHATDWNQKLYIADIGIGAVGSDGVVANTDELTSASFADFTVVANADDYVVVITEGSTPGTYLITSIVGGTITTTTAMGNDTGVSFRVERAPKIYDPTAGTLTIWTASANNGTVPTGRPFIATYNDRLVLAGGAFEPHVWEMSRAGDSLDWDFTADSDDVGRPVSASDTDQAGKIAQPIRAILPLKDRCILMVGLTQTFMIQGDPARGGRITSVDSLVGCVDGFGLSHGPGDSTAMLTRDGVYVLPGGCGSRPVSFSRERVPEDLLNVDPADKDVMLAYDVAGRGWHLFVTKNDGTSGDHWWIDWRQKGMWPTVVPLTAQPSAIHFYTSVSATDSLVLFGSRDGFIRKFDPTVEQDDGTTEIVSRLDIGPINLAGSAGWRRGSIKKITGELAGLSGDVIWKIRVGNSAQEAFDETVVFAQGKWTRPGANNVAYPKAGGQAAVIQVSNGENNQAWALEMIPVVLRQLGRFRL